MLGQRDGLPVLGVAVVGVTVLGQMLGLKFGGTLGLTVGQPLEEDGLVVDDDGTSLGLAVAMLGISLGNPDGRLVEGDTEGRKEGAKDGDNDGR